jgi:hypothetical protein
LSRTISFARSGISVRGILDGARRLNCFYNNRAGKRPSRCTALERTATYATYAEEAQARKRREAEEQATENQTLTWFAIMMLINSFTPQWSMRRHAEGTPAISLTL